MKKIYLTQGYYALIDDEDYERVNQYSWHIHKTANTLYARAKIKGISIKLHRFILKLKASVSGCNLMVDHKDQDGLNCQKTNLRLVTRSQNLYNSKVQSSSTSGITGVSWQKKKETWIAYVYKNKKQIRLYVGMDFFEACCARKSWETKT